MLRENSPALRADQIRVPVLLAHGEDDLVVQFNQARRMQAALKRQNVQHTFLTLPKDSHYLDVGQNRLTFLKEVERFLGDCLSEPQ